MTQGDRGTRPKSSLGWTPGPASSNCCSRLHLTHSVRGVLTAVSCVKDTDPGIRSHKHIYRLRLFSSFWLHLCHAEVPRPGIELTPQAATQAAAGTTLDA